jgi:hypothetical protein
MISGSKKILNALTITANASPTTDEQGNRSHKRPDPEREC